MGKLDYLYAVKELHRRFVAASWYDIG